MSETKEEEVKQEGTFKVKKPRNLSKKDEPIKIDLSKPKTQSADAIQKQETGGLPEDKRTGDIQKVETKGNESEQKPNETAALQEEKPIIEEIIDEVVEEKIAEEIVQLGEKMENRVKTPTPEEAREVSKLPENIEKVVDFMKDTGGTLEDYVRLNADYSSVDNDTLLKEYYKQTKSHLDSEEINFLIEDNFSWDEDIDEERDVRKAKLAYKEEVAKAKGHLEGLKSQYYEEIKLRPGVTQDQQKATDFFNRYNEQQEVVEQKHDTFQKNTQDYFSQNFEGFDISVGEKKFKYNIKDVDKVAENQSNINNLVEKFLDKEGNVSDTQGYHKAIYAADNVDKIATHFYEQGKADAVKDVVNKSKNLSSTKARSSQGEVFVNGFKVKAISGADSSKLKIKTRKFNN